MSNPLQTGFSLIDRKTNWIDLSLKNQPDIKGWNVYVANSLTQAYGDFLTSGLGTGTPTNLFQVKKQGYYRSNSFLRQKLGMYGEVNRGLARSLFNVEDFIGQTSSVAKASITCATVAVDDTVTIAGVVLTAKGAANFAAAQFNQSGTDSQTATSLAGCINHAAQQASITTALGGSRTITAVADGAVVNLYAGSTDTAYDTATVASSNSVRLAVSSSTLDFVKNVPFDDQMAYYRIQEVTASGARTIGSGANSGKPLFGPIYVVPQSSFFTTSSAASFVVGGTAPANTTCVEGSAPVVDLSLVTPPPMHLVLPKVCSEAFLKNDSGSATLLYSLGLESPMIALEHGQTAEIHGKFKELVLAASSTATCHFSFTGTVSWES